MVYCKYNKEALKDIQRLKAVKLDQKAKALVDIIKENPFANPPAWEALQGELKGYYSMRINIKHRLVYQVNQESKLVRIQRMWSHYDKLYPRLKKNIVKRSEERWKGDEYGNFRK